MMMNYGNQNVIVSKTCILLLIICKYSVIASNNYLQNPIKKFIKNACKENHYEIKDYDNHSTNFIHRVFRVLPWGLPQI